MQEATSPTPTVRGRDAEFAVLGVQLGRVRSGVGVVVLVEGAPGWARAGCLRRMARLDAASHEFMVLVGARTTPTSHAPPPARS